MNSKTREMMLNFINSVGILAQGTIHMIGVETCTQIIQTGEDLKDALDKDETIP